ncbi:MAG: hypothetical protein HOP17_05935 [Acidobacteria bacterium]|nr:hypothetical protein [Acidobacteriota bacterium]
MLLFNRRFITCGLFLTFVLGTSLFADAQGNSNVGIVTDEKELVKLVPKSFYFAGQSAETQMRNAAAARIGKDRLIIAGLVDTSGYSTEISGKYEGFFITDSRVNFGGTELGTGAYGFGFSSDGKVNIFDLSSKNILSTNTRSDNEMKRPRPLMMTSDGNEVRFYKGKVFVAITPK